MRIGYILCFFLISSGILANSFTGILNKADDYSQTNPDSSINLLNTISATELAGMPEKASLYYYIMAKAFYYKEVLDTSYFYIRKSLALYKKTQNRKDETRALLQAGVILESLGRYDQAMDNVQKAEKNAVELGDSIMLAKIYNLKGVIYDWKSEYNIAMDYYLKALSIAKTYKEYALESKCYINIGIIYRIFKKYNLAEEYYHKALLLSKKIKNDRDRANTYLNLGSLYIEQEKYNNALRAEFAAFFIYKKLNNSIGIAYVLNSIGYTYELLDSLDKAEYYYLRSLELSDKHDALSINATTKINLAAIYHRKNRADEALVLLNEAFQIGKEIDDKKILSDAADILSKLYYEDGDYVRAYSYLLKHKNLDDSIVSSKKIEEISKLRMQYEFEQENKQMEYKTRQQDMLFQAELEEYRFYRIIAIGTSIIAFFIVIFLIYIFRLRQKNKEHQMQEELNLYMQKTLVQQMNPHFIFNILNSIQSYIFQNDKKTSIKFIEKFAELMNVTIYNSIHNTISIKQEIEGLDLYVDLERSTFKKGFLYEVDIDDQLNINSLHIPSFIFQPIIENAIKHGILHKKRSNGKIILCIKMKENILRCSIEDNGVGRDYTSQLKKMNHTSVATNLTRERIRLLSHYYKCELGFRYIDLQDELGNALGTRVEFELPVIKQMHNKTA